MIKCQYPSAYFHRVNIVMTMSFILEGGVIITNKPSYLSFFIE